MSRSKAQVNKPCLDTEPMSLEDWLAHVLVPKHQREYEIADYEFPTDQHRNQYLETIHSRTDAEVRNLLRGFLIPSGTLGADRQMRHWVVSLGVDEVIRLKEEREFVRRMFEPPFLPWEGITWILDLLPHDPAKALDALDAFFIAHIQELPDGRFRGLSEAEDVIRHRYLQCENPRESLLSLRPNEFEYLIAALFQKMGYGVIVTQASRDGGVDVEARRNDPGGRGLVLIQCKRYEDVVRVHAVRELMGVVARRQANKGVLVATCGFTRSARQEATANAMIELIDFSSLNRLLNQYFGAKWPEHISYDIRTLQMESMKKGAGTS